MQRCTCVRGFVAFEAPLLSRHRKVFLEMKQSFMSLRSGRLGPPAQSKQQRLPPFCVAKSTQLDILKFVFMSVRYLSDLRVKNSSAASCCDAEGAVIFPPADGHSTV